MSVLVERNCYLSTDFIVIITILKINTKCFGCLKNMQKITLVVSFLLSLTACGLGGSDDECENPHPSQKAECEASEQSGWDKMNWDEGRWG